MSITNYIPHHRVINVNEPRKVSAVYDAAEKIKNKTFF